MSEGTTPAHPDERGAGSEPAVTQDRNVGPARNPGPQRPTEIGSPAACKPALPDRGRRPRLLVIGYGNELRRDDGLGPKFARLVEQSGLPELRVITCHQLTPELAEPISQAGAAVFIDAALNRSNVNVRHLSPAKGTQLRTHRSEPSQLLALAGQLFGHCPPAWWITIPAFDLGLGEGISEQAEAMMRAAFDAFLRLVEKGVPLPVKHPDP